MVFGFYHRLSASRKRVYERSDRLAAPRLDAALFGASTVTLRDALTGAGQTAVRNAAQRVADAFVAALRLPPVRIVVKRKRPERAGSEYHGYYEGGEGADPATITL